jgi:hypothetical protein
MKITVMAQVEIPDALLTEGLIGVDIADFEIKAYQKPSEYLSLVRQTNLIPIDVETARDLTASVGYTLAALGEISQVHDVTPAEILARLGDYKGKTTFSALIDTFAKKESKSAKPAPKAVKPKVVRKPAVVNGRKQPGKSGTQLRVAA